MRLNQLENDVIWTAFQLILKLRSHITVLSRFCRISVISECSFLGIGLKTKNLKITENLYFWVYKVQMHLNLFYHHFFNFLNAKTKINKSVVNLINLDGLEAFKKQTPGTWLEIWVNHF